MRTQRQVVDYALQRRALLADVEAGRVGASDVCDADPYLVRAARFHGEEVEQLCPVCAKEPLAHVSWIFGESLRHASGSARKPGELDELAAHHDDFTVYVVEVCRACRWNHVVLSYVMGTGAHDDPGTSRTTSRNGRRPQRRRADRRSAAE